jgi:hypothetical protein
VARHFVERCTTVITGGGCRDELHFERGAIVPEPHVYYESVQPIRKPWQDNENKQDS